MLTAFWNCIRRQTPAQPIIAHAPAAPLKTQVLYRRGNVPFTTEVDGGPGGIICLTDDECNELLKEIDFEMYIGAKLCELTSAQILRTRTYQNILEARKSGDYQDDYGFTPSSSAKLK